MSVVTDLFKKLVASQVLHGVVSYFETVDIPGEKRKEIALGVIKLLHVDGPWDPILENVISGAIEYVLADIRQYAKKYDTFGFPVGDVPPPQPPPPVDPMAGKYDAWHAGTLPTDQILKDMGFKVGEGKYVTELNGVAQWTVAHGGGVHNGTYEGAIG